jgi:DMSO/TMAO reductase YedYZ molybdopterin-dependent catalytic subunit
MKNCFLFLIRGLGCVACAAALWTISAAGQTSPPILAVGGSVEEPLSLTLSNLQAMPRTKATIHDKNGADVTFEGVALFELVRRAKPRLTDKCCSNTVNTVIIVRAADSYQALFSLPELDPKFNDRQILLADRRQGQALNTAQGPLQIIVPDDKAHARWVRQVNLIEVFPVGDVRGAFTNSPPP